MLFNSAQFLLLFFPVVTCAYYALPQRHRWAMLLAASAYFYAVAIPAYLFVLLFVILVDYAAGLTIERMEGVRRRLVLALSICANVGILAVFKYFDFLDQNAAHLAGIVGWNYSVRTLGLALPIGLSFHTFQSMAYTIEVYRGRQAAERHLGMFALYVLFYPQLVAGPIERPQHLLPQLRSPRELPYPDGERGGFHAFRASVVVPGLRLMLIGLFKKMVIADRLALVVNTVYDDPTLYHGVPLLVATLFFAVQIYCDFSGYTDVARGAAAVMGIRLRENFNRPYAATSIRDFWHRWHMSLSTWFRDYVYIPLGGRDTGGWRWMRNIFVTFLLSGLWHGANWTFVAWGALNGAYFIAGRATASAREALAQRSGLSSVPRLHRLIKVTTTLVLVCAGWVIFRARTIEDAWYILTHAMTGVTSSVVSVLAHRGGEGIMVRLGLATLPLSKLEWLLCLILVGGVLLRDQFDGFRHTRAAIPTTPVWLRWAADYAVVLSIIFLGIYKTSAFIYFQF